MRNLKITIQYNGSNYCGWQKQPDSLGIQGTIEKAIHDITREEVKLTGSGRTDAGVHALGQVANFKLENARSEEHTSELQSHSDLVCRLLLEKKPFFMSSVRGWLPRRRV